MSIPQQPLLDSWQRLVESGPGMIALRDCGQSKDYTRAAIENLALSYLQQLPPRSRLKRRIIFREANGVGWMAKFLAILKAGMIAVPVDPATSEEQIHSLAHNINAAWIWVNDRLQVINPRRGTKEASIVLIKLTSGSTGMPKALPFTERALMADGLNIIQTMGLRAEDRHYALIPFGHSYGLGNLVVPLLLQGCMIINGSVPLPHVIASEIASSGATVFPSVPALLSGLLRADVSRDSISSLRLLISAGAPLEGATARAFKDRLGITPHNFYGSSETGGIAYDRDGTSTATGDGIGTPLDGVEITLSHRGLVTVSSAAVTSAGRTTDSPGVHCWQLADRACWNKTGGIVLLGRSDRTVKLSGRRVDLVEVEQVIKQVSGVIEVCCLKGETPREYLAAAYSGPASELQIREKIQSSLPSWKCPKRFLQMDALPLTDREKIDRPALAKMLLG